VTPQRSRGSSRTRRRTGAFHERRGIRDSRRRRSCARDATPAKPAGNANHVPRGGSGLSNQAIAFASSPLRSGAG
jgi:hypothetical protein